MKNTVLVIAKKEFMENVRNKWIIFISVLFVLSTILLALIYLNSMWQGWGHMINVMIMPLVKILIPILALMLGYATITGEIEKGSMSALLTLPTTRREIVLGKLIGLSSVIMLAIVLGYGSAGLFISFLFNDANLVQYGAFIVASVLIGIVFASLSLLLSVFFTKRSTAIGAAIFFWFFLTMMFDLLVNGIIATIVDVETLSQGTPDLYFILNSLNPLYAYTTAIRMTTNTTNTYIQFSDYPSFFSAGLMVFILFLWMAIYLVIALLIFEKRDI